MEAKKVITENKSLNSVPYPRLSFQTRDFTYYISHCKTKNIYQNLISDKARLPIGMHRWCNKFGLTTEEIKNAFTFPKSCTLSVKSIALQYKISTYTLPTGEYLWTYSVKDNYYCDRCLRVASNEPPERDNIIHSIFSCPRLQPFITKVFHILINDCKAVDHISQIGYLLGFPDKEGLNSILLEVKKFIFYSYDPDKSIDIQISMLESRLRRLIILEKKYYSAIDKWDHFFDKWEIFSAIYMTYGPDPFI